METSPSGSRTETAAQIAADQWGGWGTRRLQSADWNDAPVTRAIIGPSGDTRFGAPSRCVVIAGRIEVEKVVDTAIWKSARRPTLETALHRPASGGVFVEDADLIGELAIILTGKEEPCPAILDQFRNSADTAPDGGKTAGLGFDVHEPRGLAPARRTNETICRLHVRSTSG